MRQNLMLAAALIAAGQAAAAMVCTASQQCRGDAQAMCAPSTLRIELNPKGPRAQIWIDRQGPYAARAETDGDLRRWRLVAFDSHRLELRADGAFTYYGNRGKRFLGRCTKGAS